MKSRQLKFVLLGVGIAVSMVTLVVVGLGNPDGFVYYVTVSEYMEKGDAETAGFRVNGKVVDGTIERDPSGQDVLFVMSDGTTAMKVSYHGIIPDTFVDGADVVVRGELGGGEVFEAHEMLAKCPSKYEAAEGYEAGDGYEDGDAAPAEEPSALRGTDVSQLTR